MPGLIQRYPDRVVLMAGSQCSVYCRHCMRKRAVGRSPAMPIDRIFRAVEAIGRMPQIRKVILSGGDPLLLPGSILADLLQRLRSLEHVRTAAHSLPGAVHPAPAHHTGTGRHAGPVSPLVHQHPV